MNLTTLFLRAALLSLGLALPALAQGPVDAPRPHDPELGRAIAHQGNQALVAIRLELRHRLYQQPALTLADLGRASRIAATDVATATGSVAAGI